MRKPFAVEELLFPMGSITADTNGLFNTYSDRAINGLLWAVVVEENSYTANGSLILAVSGETGETIWQRIGTASTSGAYLPRATLVLTDVTAISGTGNMPVDNIYLNSVLRLTGSGLGNGTSGAGIKIAYL